MNWEVFLTYLMWICVELVWKISCFPFMFGVWWVCHWSLSWAFCFGGKGSFKLQVKISIVNLKKYAQAAGWELHFLRQEFLGCQARAIASQGTLRELSQGVEAAGGEPGYIVLQPRAGSLNVKGLLLRKPDTSRNFVLFSVQEDAGVWAHWNHPVDVHPGSLGPVPRALMPRASSVLGQGAAVLHWLLDGRASPPSCVSLGSQRLPLKGRRHWWLRHPYMAGNIPFLIHLICNIYISDTVKLFSQFSCVRLIVTPWTAARQASLFIHSQSPPKPKSIESVMPSNHLILCRPLLLLPSIFPSIRVFSNESAVHIRWPKYWNFSFNLSPSNEHPGLISFRMDWLDYLQSKGLSGVFSYTTVQFCGTQLSL